MGKSQLREFNDLLTHLAYVFGQDVLGEGSAAPGAHNEGTRHLSNPQLLVIGLYPFEGLGP